MHSCWANNGNGNNGSFEVGKAQSFVNKFCDNHSQTTIIIMSSLQEISLIAANG